MSTPSTRAAAARPVVRYQCERGEEGERIN